MKYLLYFLIALLALLLQTTLIMLISIKSIEPDLLLILVVFLSLRESRARATLVGFFIGLLYDLITTSLIGLSAMTKSLAGFIVVTIAGRRKIENFKPLTTIFLATSFVQAVLFALVAAMGVDNELLKVFFRYQLPAVLYTTTIGLMIAALLPTQYWRIARDTSIYMQS